MKKTVRLLVACAGLALTTGVCGTLAHADYGDGPGQGRESCHHRHHRHHRHHCDCDCGCNHGEGRHDWREHKPFAMLAEKLDLTEAQRTKMREVFQKNMPLAKPYFEKLMKERRELRTLIQSGSADEAAIRAQAAKVAGVEADLAVQRAQMAKECRAILTPKQIEKLNALQKEREGKFDGFRMKMQERMWDQFDEPGPGPGPRE